MTSPVIRIGYLPYIVFEGPILPHKELSSSSTKYATTTVPCSKIGSLLSKIKVWAKGLYFQKTSRSKYWIYGSVLSPDFVSKVRTESENRTFQKHGLSFRDKKAKAKKVKVNKWSHNRKKEKSKRMFATSSQH